MEAVHVETRSSARNSKSFEIPEESTGTGIAGMGEFKTRRLSQSNPLKW
jgi:hypothetical protein